MTLLDQKAALDTSRIHGASLDLLSDPGIKMEHDQIRDLLLKNGASPGNEPDVVRVPREMDAAGRGELRKQLEAEMRAITRD